MRHYLYVISFVLIVLPGCNFYKKKPVLQTEDPKISLLKADKDFSEMSAAKGMKTAFLEYIDSNGVLLRPNIMPIAGADAIDYLIALNDTGYTMTWQPKAGSVAASGDMGYTYGSYILQPKITDTTFYGTYVSIWKKNADGKWKLVLDSGNEGIGNEDQQKIK